jgi:hypothetical protein
MVTIAWRLLAPASRLARAAAGAPADGLELAGAVVWGQECAIAPQPDWADVMLAPQIRLEVAVDATA